MEMTVKMRHRFCDWLISCHRYSNSRHWVYHRKNPNKEDLYVGQGIAFYDMRRFCYGMKTVEQYINFLQLKIINRLSKTEHHKMKWMYKGYIMTCNRAITYLKKMEQKESKRINVATEWCPTCENEVEINGWNVKEDGYRTYCPYCGHKLMLCDECMHTNDYHGDCKGEDGLCFRERKAYK